MKAYQNDPSIMCFVQNTLSAGTRLNDQEVKELETEAIQGMNAKVVWTNEIPEFGLGLSVTQSGDIFFVYVTYTENGERVASYLFKNKFTLNSAISCWVNRTIPF